MLKFDELGGADVLVNKPVEVDIGAGVEPIPQGVLGQVIDQFLHDEEPVGSLPAEPLAEILDAGAEVQSVAVLNAVEEEMDPFNPGEEIWQALEHEAEEEELNKLHKSQEYHPEPPVQLPDLSNL